MAAAGKSGDASGGAEQGRYRRWGILAALCLSVFILALDNTIINVALPTLADEFDASAGALKWFVEAYILAFAGLLLTGGTLGDRYGFRRALLAGLAVFGVASLLAAFAGSGAALIAGRALMGVGAALILPATLAIIKRVFPEADRAKAIAVWSATATVGAAAGPVAGGALLEAFWWGAVFLVNLPVVALTALAAWRLVPAGESSRRVPLDLPGAALSLLGVGGLVYAIIAAPGWGWTSPAFAATVAGAGIALVLFVRRELRARHPMLDLTLFRNPRFSGASQAIILVYFAFAGVAFALPQYLQYVLGHGPLVAGLLTAPVMVAGLAGGFAGAYLIRRVGTRWTLAGGLLGAAAGFVVLSAVSAGGGYLPILAGGTLLGLGGGAAATAAFDSVMGAVPLGKAGSASAVNETGMEVGNAFGVAILGTVLTAGYTRAMNGAELPEPLRSEAAASIGAAREAAARIGGSAGQELLAEAYRAFSEAMGQTALIGACFVALGAIAALMVLPRHTSKPGKSGKAPPG